MPSLARRPDDDPFPPACPRRCPGGCSGGACGPALAGPTCTTAARDTWIPEDQMKAKIAEMGFKDIRSFEVTKGNCYEIYGHDKDGRKAEVYFDPTDARIVKQEID
ncbi:PepSY domain-containing protein [Tistrella bauzanensis]